VHCVHSVGHPLARARRMCRGPAIHQVHRALSRVARDWSFGSGYGGNALLGKKCLALRIASVMERSGLVRRAHADPGRHLAAGPQVPHRRRLSFRLRQDQFAMLVRRRASPAGRSLRSGGYRVDSSGADGRLYALNPEAGVFGVAPGTGFGPIRMQCGCCSRM